MSMLHLHKVFRYKLRKRELILYSKVKICDSVCYLVLKIKVSFEHVTLILFIALVLLS